MGTGNWKGHVSTHPMSSGKYPCTSCGKEFTRKDALLRHSSIHSGIKSHHCTICSKRFSRKDGLVGHMRTHTGERPYKCQICLRKFMCKSHLTVHAQTHLMRMQCGQCTQVFTSPAEYCAHARIFHPSSNTTELDGTEDEVPIQCSQCLLVLSSTKQYAKHLRSHRKPLAVATDIP